MESGPGSDAAGPPLEQLHLAHTLLEPFNADQAQESDLFDGAWGFGDLHLSHSGRNLAREVQTELEPLAREAWASRPVDEDGPARALADSVALTLTTVVAMTTGAMVGPLPGGDVMHAAFAIVDASLRMLEGVETDDLVDQEELRSAPGHRTDVTEAVVEHFRGRAYVEIRPDALYESFSTGLLLGFGGTEKNVRSRVSAIPEGDLPRYAIGPRGGIIRFMGRDIIRYLTYKPKSRARSARRLENPAQI